jgi:hypothetical protein
MKSTKCVYGYTIWYVQPEMAPALTMKEMNIMQKKMGKCTCPKACKACGTTTKAAKKPVKKAVKKVTKAKK